MGCASSSVTCDSNVMVDQDGQHNGKGERKVFKLLLMGSECSGKSTVFKQMQMIHGEGYTPKYCKLYDQTVCSTTIQSLKDILSSMHKLQIDFADQSRIQDEYTFLELTERYGDTGLGKGLVKFMKRLWTDEGVQICFSRSCEYHLDDSASYFLNSLDRTSASDYIPSQQDILRIRVNTTGIMTSSVTLYNLHLKIYDVGGRRAERKKWLRFCSNDVTAIIFCVALSGYDLLVDDYYQRMTQMQESMLLFGSVCNNTAFRGTSIILLLTKKDIFKDKIKHIPITSCFPEYGGSHEFDECANFVQKKFENISRGGYGAEIYTYFTSAIDAECIETVFVSVADIIKKNNVEDVTLL